MKSILKDYLIKFASIFGGALISKIELSRYKLHLVNAIDELVEKEKTNYSKVGLSCIIFSKDRAIQLYSLIETYQKFVKNPVEMYIIYNTSSNDHELSYLELSNMINDFSFKINFIKEKNSFRETLLDVFSKIKTKNFFFLTDDDIFIRNIDFNILSDINPQNTILSLRHNPKISFSYTADANFKPPNFNKYKSKLNLNEFNWFDSGYEWADPCSVNGHIYLTAEFSVISRISSYKLPNSYESALKSFDFLMINRKGLCYDESIIMNLPMNIVQTEYKNLHGSVSTDQLLERWKKGYKLDVNFLENVKINSTHVNKVIDFIERKKYTSSKE